jgi:hypothetical protein
MESLGNVTLLERPFHPATLVTATRFAVRARRRQLVELVDAGGAPRRGPEQRLHGGERVLHPVVQLAG